MARSDPLDIPERVPAERVDELYGLPLEDFTASRDALAKELRGKGRRNEATWVKGLRKPSAGAWVANQLGRTQGRDAKRLIDAGAELRVAQERLLEGKGDAGELRDASGRERESVRALLVHATGLLDRDGQAPSAATLEKAEQTLEATALDDAAREAFAAGRLDRERRATGLGLVGSGGAPPPPSRKRSTAKKPRSAAPAKARQAQRAQARAAVKHAREQQRAQMRAVAAAERELERARGDAARAQRELERATRLLEKAQAGQAEASARLAEAEAAADNAS